MFLGAMLIGFSAIHVIPAVLTGKMPQKWPTKPITREDNPIRFRFSLGIFASIGLIGVAMSFWGAFQQASIVR